jgi:hypothetical protein
MSVVYNPEAETMAAIERLELEVRDVKRRIEMSRNEEDRRVLTQQVEDLKTEIARLQATLP